MSRGMYIDKTKRRCYFKGNYQKEAKSKMNRRTIKSLIQGFILCLFLLISLPLNDWTSLEEAVSQNFTVSDTEEAGQPSQYITENPDDTLLAQAYAPVTGNLTLELRYRPISFRLFVMCTFATGFYSEQFFFYLRKSAILRAFRSLFSIPHVFCATCLSDIKRRKTTPLRCLISLDTYPCELIK